MIATITWSVFPWSYVVRNQCWWSIDVTDTLVNFPLLLPTNSSCNTVMEHCVIPPHVSWGCAEYAMVRAAKNILSSPRYPYLLVLRVCLVKEKHHWKAHPDVERSKMFFLFRTFVASLLSIKRKSFIIFAWWVHISGIKYYDGKRQVSCFRLKE